MNMYIFLSYGNSRDNLSVDKEGMRVEERSESILVFWGFDEEDEL